MTPLSVIITIAAYLSLIHISALRGRPRPRLPRLGQQRAQVVAPSPVVQIAEGAVEGLSLIHIWKVVRVAW